MIDSEELLAGEWQGRVNGPSDEVRISLEESIAQDLGVSLGDNLVFDVQGVPIETVVGSFRKVDWERMQTNFFVVFPVGVLEDAPQFHVLMTQVRSAETSAQLQRTVVQRFPNVSTIDMALVLETVDAVLDNVTFVIRTMALFSVITGLVVLVGAVISSRYQRLRESVLLRTLGASRSQIRKIMAIEYLFLGVFAALTGLILALVSSWALSYFLFETEFVMEIQPVVFVVEDVGSVASEMFGDIGIVAALHHTSECFRVVIPDQAGPVVPDKICLRVRNVLPQLTGELGHRWARVWDLLSVLSSLDVGEVADRVPQLGPSFGCFGPREGCVPANSHSEQPRPMLRHAVPPCFENPSVRPEPPVLEGREELNQHCPFLSSDEVRDVLE